MKRSASDEADQRDIASYKDERDSVNKEVSFVYGAKEW